MDFDFPEDAFDFLDAPADTSDDQGPEPAADDAEPEDADIEVEETDDGAEDTDAEGAGTDEPDGSDGELEENKDEDTSDEGDDPEKDDDPDDEPKDDSFLEPFDRKKIEKDPELSKAYKHMQAAFTRKMQEAGGRVKRADTLVGQAQNVLRNHEQFTQMLADDEGAEKFLVQVAVGRPEVFNRAFERAAKLIDDPDERKRFDTEVERDRLKSQVKSTEEREAVEAAQKRERLISQATKREAEEAGLEGDEVEVASRLVKAKIQENKLLDGAAKITREEIKAAVAEAKRVLDGRAERERKKVLAERKKEQQKRIRDRAKKGRRPAPPTGGASPAGSKPRKIPEGTDPLDFAVDSLFG